MTQMTSINDQGPLQAGSLPNYANEHDPSWEEVLAMVVIPGLPEGIRNAAGNWDVIFSRIDQVQSSLEQLSRGLESWQGAAGEAYRGRLNELTQNVKTLVDNHRPVIQQLNQAADNVDKALQAIPIPDELVDETMQARQKYQQTGQVDSQFHSGWFGDLLFPGFLNLAGDIFGFLTFGLSDKASDMLRDFLTDGDDKAKAAYHALAGEHQSTASTMPNSARLYQDSSPLAQAFNPSMPGGPGGVANAPGTGDMSTIGGGSGGVGGLPTGTTLAGASGAGGLTGLGSPSSPSGLGLRPIGAAGGAGTIGAGAGGLGAASPVTPGMRAGGMTSAGTAMKGGMGGMPMMGGMGGAQGAGGGTRAAGSKSPVKGVGSMVAGGAGGTGAGAGAGARGAGGAGAAARGGMMGGGAGGEGGSGADHSTWLQEDEDVWGTESDAAPPVLGG